MGTPPSPGETLGRAIDFILSQPGEFVNNIKDLFLTKSPTEILMPGGKPIGSPGDNSGIRVLPGGNKEAEDFVLGLGKGGKDITPDGHSGILIQLPGGGGTIGYRPDSKSGPPTVDVNIPGVGIREIKFK